MKVLHVAVMLTYSPGIYNQMLCEQKAANHQALNFDSIIFSPKGEYPKGEINQFSSFNSSTVKLMKFFNWFRLRFEFYSWLSKQEELYDIVLIRYSVHDLLLLRYLKNKNKPTYLVHHTLELPELFSLGTIGKARFIADKFIGSRAIDKATGIIGVTREVVEFEHSRNKKSNIIKLVYPNGIDMDDALMLPEPKSEIPQILFIASVFSEWHGLDLLLQDLENTNSDFVLHLVGKVTNIQLEMIKNDPRVVVHGSLTKTEIQEVAKDCWVGLSSFALYRKKASEGSTLKVREYLSLGLPVYSGHGDIFPENFRYYRVGPPKIEQIIAFGIEMLGISRLQVRECSQPYIDKKIILLNLINNLKTYSSNC